MLSLFNGIFLDCILNKPTLTPIASRRWINAWKMIGKSWVVPWIRQLFRRPLTLEVRVYSQATSSEICGGEKGIWIGFFLNTVDFFCRYLSIMLHNAPHPFITFAI